MSLDYASGTAHLGVPGSIRETHHATIDSKRGQSMATDSFETAPAVLGTWPTPLEAAPRLAQALGLGRSDVWIKRDDLTGLGVGGNKVRKLEWICGAAVARDADTDRKRTRLNSSHLVISYAVFC